MDDRSIMPDEYELDQFGRFDIEPCFRPSIKRPPRNCTYVSRADAIADAWAHRDLVVAHFIETLPKNIREKVRSSQT